MLTSQFRFWLSCSPVRVNIFLTSRALELWSYPILLSCLPCDTVHYYRVSIAKNDEETGNEKSVEERLVCRQTDLTHEKSLLNQNASCMSHPLNNGWAPPPSPSRNKISQRSLDHKNSVISSLQNRLCFTRSFVLFLAGHNAWWGDFAHGVVRSVYSPKYQCWGWARQKRACSEKWGSTPEPIVPDIFMFVYKLSLHCLLYTSPSPRD